MAQGPKLIIHPLSKDMHVEAGELIRLYEVLHKAQVSAMDERTQLRGFAMDCTQMFEMSK